jgi:hypothetical protein
MESFIGQGFTPEDAAKAAGYAPDSIHRAVQRHAGAKTKTNTEIVNTQHAQAHVMLGEAGVMARLETIALHSDDPTSVSAARALLAEYAKRPSDADQYAKRLCTFISYSNGRGPDGHDPVGGSGIHVICDLTAHDRVLELLMQAVRDAQLGLEMHTIEILGSVKPPPPSAAEARPAPKPTSMPSTKRKAEPIVTPPPPAPPKVRSAAELIAAIRAGGKL